MPDEVFAFLDAVQFLHYRSPKQINWCKFFQTETVRLLVAPITVQELDEKKDGGNTAAIRDRAREALKLLDEVIDTEGDYKLRPNVFLQLSHESHSDYAEHNLDRQRHDDQLLLYAIHAAAEHPRAECCIVSRDVGLRGKAKPRNILVRKPLDEWELAPTPDPIKKELEKLRAQAAARPKLEVTFADRRTQANPSFPAPPVSHAPLLSAQMDQARREHPTYEAARNPLLIMNEPTVREYNRRILSYYEEIEKYCKDVTEYMQYTARISRLYLFLSNSGKSPATDVRVRLEFPANVTPLLDVPIDMPSVPEKPPTLNQFSSLQFGYTFDATAPRIFIPNQFDHLTHHSAFKKISQTTVEVKIRKIQHTDTAELPPLFAYFDDYLNIKPFEIKVIVVADELPNEQLKSLSVIATPCGSSHWHHHFTSLVKN